jgi:hypothetical protein
MTKPYDLVQRQGKTLDALTASALDAAEQELGYPLTIVQGSYNAGGVAASGGTHDGGGVVDLVAFDAARKVKVLRSLGFAAWHRTPAQGPWNEHIHAVLIGNEKLSRSARDQVAAYLSGRNGLRNGAADDGPRQYVDRRWTWPRPTRVARARELLREALPKRRPAARAKIREALQALRGAK